MKPRGFSGKLLGPLLKSGLHLIIINVLKPVAISVLIPLRLIAADQQLMQLFIIFCLDEVLQH